MSDNTNDLMPKPCKLVDIIKISDAMTDIIPTTNDFLPRKFKIIMPEILINSVNTDASNTLLYKALWENIHKFVEKFNIANIISFHQSQKDCEVFIEKYTKGRHENKIDCWTVKDYPHNQQGFKNFINHNISSAPQLIANTGSLADRTYIKAVDMVAFLSINKSPKDIYEAVSLAISNKNGRKCGYILLPRFIKITKGKTQKQTPELINIEEIVSVINELRNIDSEFHEILSDISIQESYLEAKQKYDTNPS